MDMLFYSRFKHQRGQILLCSHEFTFHIISFLLNCIWEGDFAESQPRDINHMHGLYKMNVPVKQLIEVWIKLQNGNWAKQWFSHHKSHWHESQIKINFPLIRGSRILIATPWLGLKIQSVLLDFHEIRKFWYIYTEIQLQTLFYLVKMVSFMIMMIGDF